MAKNTSTLAIVWLLITGSGIATDEAATSVPAGQPLSSTVVSLDGDQWLLATDPKNVGREEKWFETPRPETHPTKVPWIIQGAFPTYHGVAWYWREFAAPTNPHADGRCLLRFWAVDYLAEVWLNGMCVGGHEGGESPFVLARIFHPILLREGQALAWLRQTVRFDSQRITIHFRSNRLFSLPGTDFPPLATKRMKYPG